MKRIIILYLVMVLVLFSVSGRALGSQAEQSAETVFSNAATSTPFDEDSVSAKAFERAQSCGFVPAEWQGALDEPISYASFMKLLDQAVMLCDPERLSSWQERYPEARQLEEPIDWTNASIAIFAAAETLGDAAYESQLSYPDVEFRLSEFNSLWGDMERIPLGFDNADESSGWDYASAALNYLLMRVSMWDFTTIYPYSGMDMPDFTIQLSRYDAILACLRFYESTLYITERAPTEADEALLAAAEARKAAILGSETEVTYDGRAFYVSNAGDDSNDGLSPETAWASLAQVNDAGQNGTLRPGDAVFFNRDDIWRGMSLICAPGVTYSAYGEGRKPCIYGSEENYSGEEKWTLWFDDGEVKIWQLYRDVSEVGNIVFNDGESYATRVYAYHNGKEWVVSGQDQRPFDAAVDLKDDLTFYSTFPLSSEDFDAYAAQGDGSVWVGDIDTTGPLYLRCDAGNPGAIYHEIEFHQSSSPRQLISQVIPAGDNVIDNLCVRYSVTNGISIAGDGPNNIGKGNNIIQNCEVGWNGGSQAELCRPDRDVMVCGEDIVWTTDDNQFLNNYVHQACCAGFVSEFVGDTLDPESVCVGTVLSGNLIEKCQDTFWFWDNDLSERSGNIVLWENTTISDNYVLYMGYGWSGDDRFLYGGHNPTNTFHKRGEYWDFHIGGMYTGVRNMLVKGNVFYLTAGGSILAHDQYAPWDGLVFDGNTYVENDNRRISSSLNCRNIVPLDVLSEVFKEEIGDQNAIFFPPSCKTAG